VHHLVLAKTAKDGDDRCRVKLAGSERSNAISTQERFKVAIQCIVKDQKSFFLVLKVAGQINDARPLQLAQHFELIAQLRHALTLEDCPTA